MSLEQIKVELLDWWPKQNGDRSVALQAWASSFDKEKAEKRGPDEIGRVVKQIVDHHHDTPKERIWMEYFLSVPIFVERQVDKYRLTQQIQDIKFEAEFASFGRWGITQNELSGRYRTLPERWYSMPDDVCEILAEVDPNIIQEYQNLMTQEFQLYQKWLESFPKEWRLPKLNPTKNVAYKRAREVLRGVLGTATITDMRIVLNLNALEHILNQRLAPDAQLESRVVALKMLEQAQQQKVAEQTIQEMIDINGWESLCQEIRLKLGI